MLSLHSLVKNVDLSNAESVDEVCAKINAMDVSRNLIILNFNLIIPIIKWNVPGGSKRPVECHSLPAMPDRFENERNRSSAVRTGNRSERLDQVDRYDRTHCQPGRKRFG